MFSWVKFVQGLVALASWLTRKLERQENIKQGETNKELADAQLELQLDKQIKAIDNSFDANAERMQQLYGNKTVPPGSSKR